MTYTSNILFLIVFQLYYRYDYNTSIKGTNTSPAVTIESERARLANHIQSNVRQCFLLLYVWTVYNSVYLLTLYFAIIIQYMFF